MTIHPATTQAFDKVFPEVVLTGGGEMGQLMRSIDWSPTALGAVETWPQSLRTVLGLLLASEHPIFVWWGSELIQFYNDAYRPILGSTKHPAALGQQGKECWGEIWDVIAPMIDKVFSGGSTYTKDGLLVLDRHGFLEECYFNYAYSPIRGESQEVAGVFVACNETTGRVIGERRLKTLTALAGCTSEAKDPLEACHAVIPELSAAALDIPFALIYLLDGEGNHAALAVSVGVEAGHRAAPPSIDLQAESGAWNLSKALRSEFELQMLELESELPSGPWPEAPSRAALLPLKAAGCERPHGFLIAGLSPRLVLDEPYKDFLGLVAQHVTSAIQHGNVFAAERRRAESLAELDRAKTAFFSNVSHEFRTPLTLMLGPVQDCLSDRTHPLSPVQQARLELVQRNGQRLQKLVNAILDFSRLGAGRLLANLQPTDISSLTVALAASFEPLITGAGLHFEVDCEPTPEPVWVDPAMWEKIALNLLSNAFKFTLSGGITVRLRHSSDGVELCVSDTGVGIDADDQAHIFERFHRIEGVRGRSDEGSGIGLALVRELVNLHAGEVSVQSQAGVGTTFKVTVPTKAAWGLPQSPGRPRESVAPYRQAYLEEAKQWLNKRGSDSAELRSDVEHMLAIEPLQPQGHVLLADDNADMRGYITQLLAHRFTVQGVADGEQALAAAQVRPPDVVLSDVMMPGLDGFGLVRALKADPRTAHVPVMLISARAGEEATVEGLGAGVADYLVKPFGGRELVARVEVVVKAKQAQTERARLLREVDASRARLMALFDNAPAFLCALGGPEHVFEMFNQPYRRLVGTDRPLLGLAVKDALPEVVSQGFLKLLDGVYRTGEPFVGRGVAVSLDRKGIVPEEAFIDFTYQPRRGVDGNIEGIDVFGFDVTEQVLARKQAELLSQKLRQADERKDEFLAMLAHELRNPMAAISMALTLLEEAPNDVALTERYRGTARRQMSHLVRLVDDLLDVSRITRGKVELRKEHIDFAAVVQSAVTAVRATVEARQHQLSVTLSSGEYAMKADATRLEQVVVNLLTNAAKYSEPGGQVDVVLSQETTPDGTTAVLSVRDTGRGIPSEMLSHVFDMFVQVSPSIDRAAGGLGLGLTLVKRLVELHHGTASAHSEGRGRGSEFVVRLPLSARKHATNGATVNVTHSSETPLRIVVVEDSEDIRELLKEFLTLSGHEVTTAVDGIDGATKILAVRPDVALIDVGLPEIDGYEVARRVRTQQGHSKPLLVALTGYGGSDAKTLALNAGFDLHLTKPVEVRALTQVLAGVRP